MSVRRLDRTRLTALLAGACCLFFLPLATAAPAAAITVYAVLRWMPFLQSKTTMETALEQRLALPLALDVLSLALDAGVAWDRSVAYAADCCSGALEHELRLASSRLAMGAAPNEVWRGSPVLSQIGVVVERSFRSGAAVSALLRQQADRERAEERLRRIENSRRLGTKILIPVAFLGYPAFVVLALVPTLVSTFLQLDIGLASTP